jgi:hypothetical protein
MHRRLPLEFEVKSDKKLGRAHVGCAVQCVWGSARSVHLIKEGVEASVSLRGFFVV